MLMTFIKLPMLLFARNINWSLCWLGLKSHVGQTTGSVVLLQGVEVIYQTSLKVIIVPSTLYPKWMFRHSVTFFDFASNSIIGVLMTLLTEHMS